MFSNMTNEQIRCGIVFSEAKLEYYEQQWLNMRDTDSVISYFGFWVPDIRNLNLYQAVEYQNRAESAHYHEGRGWGRGFLSEVVACMRDIHNLENEMYNREKLAAETATN